MPRRRQSRSRARLLPDPVYNSTLVEKFVNSMMWDGKKTTAQGIFYGAMENIRERSGRRPAEAVQEGSGELQAAAGSEDPARGRRQLPGADRSSAEPPHQRWRIRWIISNARARPEKGMAEKLANELNDAANMRGGAIKKKDDVHRMAEANKAFAHYRW